MLPLSYSVRNLGRFPWKTLQTVLASTLVVFLVVCASAFNRGISRCLAVTGDPANVIVLGAGSEESLQRSEISRVVPDILASSLGEARRILGKPAVSSEVYYMGMAACPGERPRPALFRGVTWNALNVHRGIAITAGRFPNSGEMMAGRQAARHLGLPPEALAIGKTLVFEGISYRIVGHFEGQGTMMEAELWMDLNDLLNAAKRETVSCAVVSLRQPQDAAAVSLFCSRRIDLELAAIPEPQYYATLSRFYEPIRMMVWLTAFLVSAAAVFGSINTSYAAIIVRRRELATLQAIGASRRSLLLSLLMESLLVNLAGALAALTLAGLLLPAIHISFSTGVFSLVFDNLTLGLGFLTALALGLLGVAMPAWGCLFPPIVSSLRSA